MLKVKKNFFFLFQRIVSAQSLAEDDVEWKTNFNIIITIKNIFQILTRKMSSCGGIRANTLAVDCPTLKSAKVNFYFV